MQSLDPKEVTSAIVLDHGDSVVPIASPRQGLSKKDTYFASLKQGLDQELLTTVRDQVYERNEYEALKILRNETAIV